MTKEFIRRVPYVWPTINIPTPYGATPLYDDYLAQGRILTSMPFAFYYMPYLVMTLKNYTPQEYYEKLIDIYSTANSYKLLGARVRSTPDYSLKVLYFLRAFAFKGILGKLTRTLNRFRDDEEFRNFHEGRTTKLPSYYRQLYTKRLGRYAELISEAEMTPKLEASAVMPTRSIPKSPARAVQAPVASITGARVNPN
jgi:hypothetical protein